MSVRIAKDDPARRKLLLEDGEIPFLDADPLDDSLAAFDNEKPLNADDLAIERLVERLRRKSGRSGEAVEDTAIALYNKVCDDIRSRRASDEQIARAAELFGEPADELVERLRASE